jgi:hypothetical protein
LRTGCASKQKSARKSIFYQEGFFSSVHQEGLQALVGNKERGFVYILGAIFSYYVIAAILQL